MELFLCTMDTAGVFSILDGMTCPRYSLSKVSEKKEFDSAAVRQKPLFVETEIPCHFVRKKIPKLWINENPKFA